MVMRHRLLNVTVDRVPFNPSVLGSLLSPASLGIPGAGSDGLSVGGGGGGGVEAATAAGSMLGPLVSSMAADIFRQAVGGDEWAMADVDDDEEEGEEVQGLAGAGEELEGARPGLYAQRVLSLMKTLHADVPALLEV